MSLHFTVSKKALLGRINRVLAKRSLRMKVTQRASPFFDTLGRHSIFDTDTKAIVDHHIPLEMYANDLGVLSVLECLVD